MTWNDPGLVIDHRECLFGRCEHTANITTAAQVNEGKTHLVEEQVAHVQHIGLFPENDAVAVGVAMLHVPDLHFVAIEVKLQAIVIGHGGQCFGRRSGIIAASRLLDTEHPFADMVMGHDQSAGLAEILVSAAVITMPVSVDQIFDRLRAQLRDCRFYLGGQRRELIVDQHRAVRTIGNPDISPCPE